MLYNNNMQIEKPVGGAMAENPNVNKQIDQSLNDLKEREGFVTMARQDAQNREIPDIRELNELDEKPAEIRNEIKRLAGENSAVEGEGLAEETWNDRKEAELKRLLAEKATANIKIEEIKARLVELEAQNASQIEIDIRLRLTKAYWKAREELEELEKQLEHPGSIWSKLKIRRAISKKERGLVGFRNLKWH